MKLCHVCNRELPESEFYTRGEADAKHRARTDCKRCTNDRVRKRWRILRQGKYGWHLLRGARHRAKEQGLPFNIDEGDVRVPERCPYLGIDIVPYHHDKSAAASIDRIVPSLGYVKGNVIVVSGRANRIKSDATPDELERIASAVRAATVRSRLMRMEAWIP